MATFHMDVDENGSRNRSRHGGAVEAGGVVTLPRSIMFIIRLELYCTSRSGSVGTSERLSYSVISAGFYSSTDRYM